MNLIQIIRNIICNTSNYPDVDYMTERIKTLSTELAHCIGTIDIIEDHKTIISPHDIIDNYDMVVADHVYLLYTIEDWTAIITRLHKHLREKYKWTKSVYDCDNISLLYASTLGYSAYRAGLAKQPCFGVAWSNTHAFNLLIDSNSTVWVVEPQTGIIIKRLNDSNGKKYDVQKIWFLS